MNINKAFLNISIIIIDIITIINCYYYYYYYYYHKRERKGKMRKALDSSFIMGDELLLNFDKKFQR